MAADNTNSVELIYSANDDEHSRLVRMHAAAVRNAALAHDMEQPFVAYLFEMAGNATAELIECHTTATADAGSRSVKR